MEISPGARIDRYLLVEPLGEGGQGSVWKAVDALDATRTVALKLVSIAQTKPTQLERVRREARALAKLEHSSLVRCEGLFEDFKASVLGLVLELVDGKSLADALDDKRFKPELRWAVLQHVGRALAHLHDRHIIHRDLKPENIVLAEGFWTAPHDPSTVKLIDFGIAAEEGNPNPLTAYGNVIGTPAYMAPELIDATYFAGGRPTPAVDVFAFGVVAWILLVGGHPTGLSAESTLVDYAMEYRKVVTGERTWALTGGPPFVAQCLEPRPERRLQTGSAVIDSMRGTPPTPAKATVPIGAKQGTIEAAPAPDLFRPRIPRTEATAPEPSAIRSSNPRTSLSVAWGASFLVVAMGTLAAIGVVAVVGFWVLSGNSGASPGPGAAPVNTGTSPPPAQTAASTAPGGELDLGSERSFRFDGVIMGPGSSSQSFPGPGESLEVQVIRTGRSCSVFQGKSCRLPMVVQDLTAAGQGVALRFFREGYLIGSATRVRLKEQTISESSKGYWVPITTFAPAVPAPFGPTGSPKHMTGFVLDAD